MGRESDWIGEGERESIEGEGDERLKKERRQIFRKKDTINPIIYILPTLLQ